MDIKELLDIVTLKKIDDNRFEGKNYETVWGRVFGGQVLSQSLHAAYQTVPDDRIAHSMHGYFILPGNLDIPVTYEVDKIRNGGSFTTRRVVAFQNEKAIFNMAASFQKKEKGFDHQVQMPNVLSPDLLMTDFQQAEKHKDELAERYQLFLMAHPKVFEFKPVGKCMSQTKCKPNELLILEQDDEYLKKIKTLTDAGIKTIVIMDSAGIFLPNDLSSLITLDLSFEFL